MAGACAYEPVRCTDHPADVLSAPNDDRRRQRSEGRIRKALIILCNRRRGAGAMAGREGDGSEELHTESVT